MNRATCEQCGKQIQYPEEHAGRKARCPGCSSPILLGPGASDQSAHVSSMRIQAVDDEGQAPPRRASSARLRCPSSRMAGQPRPTSSARLRAGSSGPPEQPRWGRLWIGLPFLLTIGCAYLLFFRGPRDESQDGARKARSRTEPQKAAGPAGKKTQPAPPRTRPPSGHVLRWKRKFQPALAKADAGKQRLRELESVLRGASGFLLRVRGEDAKTWEQLVAPLRREYEAEFKASLGVDTQMARGWAGLLALLEPHNGVAAAARELRCKQAELELLLGRPPLEPASGRNWLVLAHARSNLQQAEILGKQLGAKLDPGGQRKLSERKTEIRLAYSQMFQQTLDRLSAEKYRDATALRQATMTCQQLRQQLDQSAQFVLAPSETQRLAKLLTALERKLAKARSTPEPAVTTKDPPKGPTVADLVRLATPLLARLDRIWSNVAANKLEEGAGRREAAADHRGLLTELERLPGDSQRQMLSDWAEYASGVRARTTLELLAFIARSAATEELRRTAQRLHADLAKKAAARGPGPDLALQGLKQLEPLPFADPYQAYSIQLPKGWTPVKRKPRRFAASRKPDAPSMEVHLGQARQTKTLAEFFKLRGASFARGASEETKLSDRLVRRVDRSHEKKLEAVYLTQIEGHRGYCELRFRCPADQASALLPVIDAAALSLRAVPPLNKWQGILQAQMTLLKPELPDWQYGSMSLHPRFRSSTCSAVFLRGWGLVLKQSEQSQVVIRVNWFGDKWIGKDQYTAGYTSVDGMLNEMWAELRKEYYGLPVKPAVQQIKLGQVVARATPFFGKDLLVRLIVTPGFGRGKWLQSDKYAIVVTSQAKHHLRNAEVIDAILRTITVK